MSVVFLAALLSLQTGVEEDKEECKKALETFRAAVHASADSSKIAAIDTLAKHKCPNAVAALTPFLVAESDKVRIAAAHAIGGIDHPKSLEALSLAVPPNEGTKDVLEALAKALQTLDREAGADVLVPLLSKYHEKGMTDELKIVIQALGAIGSETSVGPLLQLLEHAENEGKAGRVGKLRSTGNPKLVALEGPIKAALQAITGGSEPNYAKWKEWWRENRERLLESATMVYWCRATGKRFEEKAGAAAACPYHDKPEKDGQLVKTRLKPKA